MKTLEPVLVKDEIITTAGRVFRPGNKALLESLPPDIVTEMAKRRLAQLKAAGYEVAGDCRGNGMMTYPLPAREPSQA
jgi:hypothetical protein